MNELDAMNGVLLVGNIDAFSKKEVFKRYQKKINQDACNDLRIQVTKGRILGEVIRLTDLQREAVIKYFWGNEPIEDIACRMHLSRKSVLKLIETALATIKQRLVGEKEPSPA